MLSLIKKILNDGLIGESKKQDKLNQHIAVFGESGSGKTTLISAFYGWHQSRSVSSINGYKIHCQDTSQGQKLQRGYFNMAEDNLPPATRYEHSTVSFDLNISDIGPYNEIVNVGTLHWHDYPGEWWTETKDGVEQESKLKAFRSLIQSDIAFFLCDADKINKNGSAYIKSLFRSFTDELRRLINDMKDTSNIKRVPETWVICLSKADISNLEDVDAFKRFVILNALDEINELKDLIKTVNSNKNSLSTVEMIGESYLFLSAAQFDKNSNSITDINKNIGLDLISPIAYLLPLQYSSKVASFRTKSTMTVTRLTEFVDRSSNLLSYLPFIGPTFSVVAKITQPTCELLLQKESEAKEKRHAVDALLYTFLRKTTSNSSRQYYVD